MKTNLDICCLNCRGLRSKQKRNTLFKWLNDQKRGLIMLQETHSDDSVEESWEKEYEGKIYFSHWSSSGRGVALLIPKYMNEQLPIKAIETDKEGRILLAHTEMCNREVIVVNIYAPTKDNITLQNELLENLKMINH